MAHSVEPCNTVIGVLTGVDQSLGNPHYIPCKTQGTALCQGRSFLQTKSDETKVGFVVDQTSEQTRLS